MITKGGISPAGRFGRLPVKDGFRTAGRLRSFVQAVILVVTSVSCASQPALPPKPATVDVTMREFRYDHGPIPGGRVVFRIPNAGTVPHRLSLVPLPAHVPPIQEQLKGEARQVVFTQASIPDTLPGQTGTFAVDLAPGRYAMICFNVDENGKSHALQGMAKEFQVPARG